MALLIALLIAVEVAAGLGAINPILFPRPSQLVAVFAEGAVRAQLFEQLGITLLRAGIGFALAACVALPIGLVLGVSESLRATFTPLIEILRPIPSSAMVPIAILFLGLGTGMILFVIWFGTLWPLLVNAIYGARGVDSRHKELAKLLRLNTREYFSLVVLPSAVPHVLAGARVALSIALILAVTAEMLAGQNGIGYRLLDYERAFRYPEMYAALALLAVTGLGLNLAFAAAQSTLRRRFSEFE